MRPCLICQRAAEVVVAPRAGLVWTACRSCHRAHGAVPDPARVARELAAATNRPEDKENADDE